MLGKLNSSSELKKPCSGRPDVVPKNALLSGAKEQTKKRSSARNIKPVGAYDRRAADIKRKAKKLKVNIGSGMECLPNSPCADYSCIRCRHDYQHKEVAKYRDVARVKLKRRSRRTGKVRYVPGRMVTIVADFGQVPLDGDGSEVNQARDKLKRLLKYHAPKARGLLWDDFTLNVVSGIGEENHVQMHWHGVLWGFSKRAQSRLTKAINKSSAVHKPIKRKRITDPVGCIGYPTKPAFCRRISLKHPDRRRNTRKKKLTLAQEVKLMVWLSGQRVSRRGFEVGDTRRILSVASTNKSIESDR